VNDLVAALNSHSWIGRRDRAVLLLAIQTGLRNSEITTLLSMDNLADRDIEPFLITHRDGPGMKSMAIVASGRKPPNSGDGRVFS